jgi:hypothetical protein
VKVTVSTAVAALPAASRAVIVIVFAPLASAIAPVLQLVVPVAVTGALEPICQMTCATPTLSPAVPLNVTVLAVVLNVEAVVGEVIATVGADVSVSGVLETVSVAVAVFPAASRAVIVMTFGPFASAIAPVLQLVVPLAVPLPPALFAHETCVTPTLSPAVPLNVTVAEVVLKVDPAVGDEIATVGATLSAVPTSSALIESTTAVAAAAALRLVTATPTNTVCGSETAWAPNVVQAAPFADV